jgi:shikimate dehydrogenase
LCATPVVVRARALSTWAPSPAVEAVTRAVVQATSAGMRGADPGEAAAAVVAWDALPSDAVALDVVYAPPDTPFLHAARARGLRCTNGLGMLARQGALAFELWLGVPAPLEAMLAALTDRR